MVLCSRVRASGVNGKDEASEQCSVERMFKTEVESGRPSTLGESVIIWDEAGES